MNMPARFVNRTNLVVHLLRHSFYDTVNDAIGQSTSLVPMASEVKSLMQSLKHWLAISPYSVKNCWACHLQSRATERIPA